MDHKSLISKLEEFRDKTGKFNSLFTFIFHDVDVENIISKLYHRLEIIKKIKSSYRRKYLNDRLYNFIQFWDNKNREDTINSIYLLDNEINEIKLNNKYIDILREYNIKKIIMKYDENFAIDYLISLFTDMNLKHVICVMANKMEHICLNDTKRKILYSKESKENNVKSYVETNISQKCLIHGVSSHLKYLKLDDHHIYTKLLSDDEILNIFKKDDMLENHKLLEECLSYLNNEDLSHRVLIGKDIEKAVANYKVKRLFCTETMFDKVIKVFPRELLNFQIIKISMIEKNDICDTLEKNYKGIVGFSYY